MDNVEENSEEGKDNMAAVARNNELYNKGLLTAEENGGILNEEAPTVGEEVGRDDWETVQ